MPALIDLTGKRFGPWLVLDRAENTGANTRWRCACVCGQERAVEAVHLKRWTSIDCGCIRRHGAARRGNRTPTYRCWVSMRKRVLYRGDKNYWRYGGRGIRICERWNDYSAFLADMGERPSLKHSIDRIDGNGHYEPANCRWATPAQQVANRSLVNGYRQKQHARRISL